MSVIGSNILAGSSGVSDAYTIDQSLRCDDGDSSELSRTFSAGDSKTFTISCWVKRGSITDNTIFIYSAGPDSNNKFEVSWDSTTDKMRVENVTGSSRTLDLVTTPVYRDVASWYHICLKIDTTPATPSSSSIGLYINGTQVTDFDTETYPSQDDEMAWNKAYEHNILRSVYNSYYFDGYIAEFNAIDGTALDADSFGETDSTTNQWKPIEYTGSYGTNGFYQKYAGTELANSFFDSGYGGRHSITAQGDAHTDTSVKKIGTASLQCDGTGDYLLGPTNNSDFVFGTGDFTIESWIRMDDVTSTSGQAIGNYGDSSGYNGWTFRIRTNEATDRIDFCVWDATSLVVEILSTTLTWVNDTWYHVAVVRSGNDFNLYRDGVSVATTVTNSGSMVATSSGKLHLAADYSGGALLEGYLDELRISDTARYVDDFTPSTTAFTNDANTLLLLHMDGADDGTSFPDSASHAITAVGDVANTRAQSKIGDSSIYFEDGSDDYLTIPTGYDFGTGDFTIEMWVKVTSPVNGGNIICSDTVNQGYIGADNQTTPWTTYFAAGGADPEGPSIDLWGDSAWHHVAVVRKTANSGEEISLYIDGTEGTKVEDTASHDYTGYIFGHNYDSSVYEFNGYMDEIRVSSVARYDGDFTPSTTEFTADANTKLLIHSNWDGGLGADSSGNENDFAVTNLVATDQMEDSPTNNFSTMNPLDNYYASSTFSEGNLKVATDGTIYTFNTSTIKMPSGKWYWELLWLSGTGTPDWAHPGISSLVSSATNDWPGKAATSWSYSYDGQIYNNASGTSYGDTFAVGVIIGVAVDLTNNNLYFSKNGTWQNSGVPTSGATGTGAVSITAGDYFAVLGDSDGDSCTFVANFGSDSSFAGNETAQGNQDDNEIGDFYYDVPDGFLALCTSNLSDPEIADPTDHFNTVIFTGNASADKAVTGVGFAPDLGWFKSRTSTDNNVWYDSVRGVSKALRSSTTGVETATSGVTAFDSDGYTLGDNTMSNYSGAMVSWNWLGDGVSGGTLNQDGTIDSQVNVNTTAGFSIVKYTGNDTGGATVGHGLSQAPNLTIVKPIDLASAWKVNSDSFAMTDVMYLDEDAAAAANIGRVSAFGASTFTLASDNQGVNSSSYDYIAYCFHSVEGYSKVGSYEGNDNDDGPFLYTGFRPAYLMTKNVTAANSWIIKDNKRDPFNADGTDYNHILEANDTGAEGYYVDMDCDFCSNGIKIRNPYGGQNDAETYLYIAFAESPFKTSNAR